MPEKIDIELQVSNAQQQAESLSKLFSKELASSLKDLGGHVNPELVTQRSLANRAGSAVGAGIGGVANIATGLAGGVAGLAGGFMAVTTALKGMADQADSFVRVANPAVSERYHLALQDISGVIGRTLTPFLEMATKWVRLFGDSLASILPSSGQMREILKEFDPILQQARTTMEQLAPVLRDTLVFAVRIAIKAIELFTGAIFRLADKLFGRLAIGWAALKGDQAEVERLSKGGPDPLSSSFGAAAQKASFTSAGQLGQNMIMGALQKGGESDADKQAKAAEDQKAAAELNTKNTSLLSTVLSVITFGPGSWAGSKAGEALIGGN